MTDPLAGFEFRFPNFKGLSASPGDWLTFGRTTIIVGRNNVGKSAIIDALRFSVDDKAQFNTAWNRNGGEQAGCHVRCNIGEPELRRIFSESTAGGPIHGNHWSFGVTFLGQVAVRSIGPKRERMWIEGPNFDAMNSDKGTYLKNLADYTPMPVSKVFGVAAERQVLPEVLDTISPVTPDGKGLTNLIRAFLYDASLDMAEIEDRLLGDLNYIYQADSHFTRIMSQRQHDGRWEIYLTSSESGTVPLSQSGSSLQSVFIVLATLRLNPLASKELGLEGQIFYVEEPENNLHPSLLRSAAGLVER